MKTQIAVKPLIAALTHSAKIVARKTSVPILANALLEVNTKPGEAAVEFSIVTTDLEITQRITLPNPVRMSAGKITVPARRFLDAVKSSHGEVEIETLDGAKMAIRNGSNFTLPTLPPDEFPAIAEIKNGRKMIIAAGVLRGALDRVSHAISTDESRYVLNGVFFQNRVDSIRFIATDGRRLHVADIAGGELDTETARQIEQAEYNVKKAESERAKAAELFTELEKQFQPVYAPVTVPKYIDDSLCLYRKTAAPQVAAQMAAVESADQLLAEMKESLAKLKAGSEFILPTKAADRLCALLPKKDTACPISIEYGAASIKFSWSNGGEKFELYSKLVEGNYPNYTHVIPNDCKERIVFQRGELLEAVTAAEKMTTEKSRSIKLHFTKNNFTGNNCAISANSPEFGEFRKEVPTNHLGAEFAIAFQTSYIREALAALPGVDEITASFTCELSPGVFAPNATGEIKSFEVIMPMRLS